MSEKVRVSRGVKLWESFMAAALPAAMAIAESQTDDDTPVGDLAEIAAHIAAAVADAAMREVLR
jgi:hypothetical protein